MLQALKGIAKAYEQSKASISNKNKTNEPNTKKQYLYTQPDD